MDAPRQTLIYVNPELDDDDQAALIALWGALTKETPMAKVHIRTAAKDPTGNDYPVWLKVIHTVNEFYPATFAKPNSIDEWWAGGTSEEYDHARVLHRGDGSVSIVSKTDFGARALRTAARHMNIYVS